MAGEPDKYDRLYNPRLTVPDYAEFAARWSSDSQKARATLDGYFDVPYGPDGTQTLDIFRSKGRSQALLLFIHGGYWRALDKKDFSFIAPSFVRAGVTVAVVNYALCPVVQLRDIVMQVVQACAWLYRNGTNFGAPLHSLYVCGHSAGGHLTTMMLACDWRAYARDLPAKVVEAGLAISGLYDLRDIMRTPSINCDVRLDERAAGESSPAFMPPATDAPLYLAVGEKENEGFHLQQRLLARKWRGVLRSDLRIGGCHHFSVLDSLTRAGGELHAAALRMMGL